MEEAIGWRTPRVLNLFRLPRFNGTTFRAVREYGFPLNMTRYNGTVRIPWAVMRLLVWTDSSSPISLTEEIIAEGERLTALQAEEIRRMIKQAHRLEPTVKPAAMLRWIPTPILTDWVEARGVVSVPGVAHDACSVNRVVCLGRGRIISAQPSNCPTQLTTVIALPALKPQLIRSAEVMALISQLTGQMERIAAALRRQGVEVAVTPKPRLVVDDAADHVRVIEGPSSFGSSRLVATVPTAEEEIGRSVARRPIGSPPGSRRKMLAE